MKWYKEKYFNGFVMSERFSKKGAGVVPELLKTSNKLWVSFTSLKIDGCLFLNTSQITELKPFVSIKSNSNDLPQYSSLYLKRLEITKKKLFEDCKKKWPKVHICKNILDLKGNVIIIFIIFFEFLERANYNWAHI